MRGLGMNDDKFDFAFARNTHLIKQIGKLQLAIDPLFKKNLQELRMKLYEKKVAPTKFWENYKKILQKSIGKDKQILNALLKKTDKKLKQQFKEAQAEWDKKEPVKYPDLSLPS